MNEGVIGQQAEVDVSAIDMLMDNVVVTYIIKIFGAILVIIFLLMISKIVANIVSKRIVQSSTEGNKHIDKIGKLIHDIVFYILVIFSFFIGFEIVGFNVGLIIGGISFGVGLAFKEILGNMIAGMMMLYTKEFKLGDIVEVYADQTYFGRIEEITIRYTIIRTLDLRQVVLPNMTLITVPIKTFSSEDLIKLKTTFKVHFNTDIPKAIEIILETINSFSFVKEKENSKVFFSQFLESNIEIKAFFYFDPKCGIIPDIAIGEINGKVNEAFKQNNIDISYDMVTLTFEEQKAKTDIIQNLQQ
ncbi:MAG: mechanosensitive ion channel [Candidatus Absconditabacteria bacterium]|nr:mechanosensitive ion channel [Candidatus Absconditabacteria bacterium]